MLSKIERCTLIVVVVVGERGGIGLVWNEKPSQQKYAGNDSDCDNESLLICN